MIQEQVTTFGTPRQRDYVRVLRVGVAESLRLRVQWRDPKTGKVKTRSYGDATPASLRAARKLGEDLAFKLRAGTADAATARLTVADVWAKFEAVRFADLRPNTQRNYALQFRQFAEAVGPATKADAIDLTALDTVRTHYRGLGWAHRTVREIIATAKLVWRWAHSRRLVSHNWLIDYRYVVPKDERTASPDEFDADEFLAIMAQLDPNHGGQWRAYVALMIAGAQGARQHAVLHLQWADVDEAAGVITWQGAFDKNGETWTQPLRKPTRQALAVARAWQAGERGTRRFVWDTPWVLPGAHALSSSETYTSGALWLALTKAEKRADVTHRKGRGAHGLRRMVAGDVHALTGDAMLALQAIGDRDPKMLDRYLHKRDTRVRSAFDRLDEPKDGET